MSVGRTFLWASAALIVGIGVMSYNANKAPHTAVEVARLSDRLLEFGAVDFVHASYDGAEIALFECVAAGQPLSPDQSIRYRKSYQAALLEKQGLFARLDQNIELRQDEGMQSPNNAGGTGIKGLHDHHDGSASNNIANIAGNLQRLETAGPLRRAVLANDIYKDLTDLMVHLAPAVHSVGLVPLDPLPAQTHPDYSAFYKAMKQAQTAPVNSAPYWAALDAAKVAYGALLEDVQHKVRAANSPLLHAVSGRWLALQTVAPRLSETSPSAEKRKKGGTHGPPCRS